MITAIQTPFRPWGMKPPGRPTTLCSPTGACPRPNTADRPRMMNTMIAITLMEVNQYSSDPKFRTERELMNRSAVAKPSDQSQTGEPGNQKDM